MPTSFEVLFLGNLPDIDTGEGNQFVSQTAVDSWLGTYGSAADPLASTDNVKNWEADSFSGGLQPASYDIDNNASNDTFTVDGVTQTHDATMIFNATITYFDGTTANITAVVSQATNGDVYLMPEFSANADQAAIEAAPIQSIQLISPIYANGNPGQGYNLVADRQAADLVPCFTLGTMIATDRGEIPVEALKIGDRVMTRDNGLQDIRWIGRRDVSKEEVIATPEWAPIRVAAGALSGAVPETDLLLSPNHRVLITGERAALFFGENEVLVAAKHLVSMDGVSADAAGDVVYFHILFDRHEVILSNGAWTESFQPADYTLRSIGDEQREEVYGLFPELKNVESAAGWSAARKVLKRHEARLLTA
ncbi:Hint domain-containing protein [Pseudooctadecabacter sp.]|uniref:Hint domain-containing protein n=1 Tax=Pseudooctadecabacter sp. TaxID=1966338 RepID=UPI003F6A7BAD